MVVIVNLESSPIFSAAKTYFLLEHPEEEPSSASESFMDQYPNLQVETFPRLSTHQTGYSNRLVVKLANNRKQGLQR